MVRKIPSKEELAEFREAMNEMATVSLDILSANATKYAEALGTFRSALEKAGFSAEESMQIILKITEPQGRRPIFAGGRGSHRR